MAGRYSPAQRSRQRGVSARLREGRDVIHGSLAVDASRLTAAGHDTRGECRRSLKAAAQDQALYPAASPRNRTFAHNSEDQRRGHSGRGDARKYMLVSLRLHATTHADSSGALAPKHWRPLKPTQTSSNLMRHLVILTILGLLAPFSWAQTRPDLIYYQFNNAGSLSVQNGAISPVGTNPAPLLGGMTVGGAGQFGSALVGVGGDGASQYVNTGWATNLPATGWTISFWYNNLPDDGAVSYLVGDDSTTFRIFKGGVANPGNMIVRGAGLDDTTINGALLAQPSVVHVVYDPTGPTLRTYVNGVPNSAIPQASLSITSPGPLKVGSWTSAVSLPPNALMDEFRLYSRPLDAPEIASTWNVQFSVPTSAASTASIPTLSEWALIMLATIMAMIGLARTRRR